MSGSEAGTPRCGVRSSSPKVWITGAAGLIGNYLIQLAPAHAPNFEVIPLTRDRLDLTDAAATRALFKKDRPQLVIHCAAISKSPACQANPDLARAVNVDATARLAELAADIPFFFFSTDLVFDGLKGNYTESDTPNPLSVYAETKMAAENIVLANPRHTVIRTSINYGCSTTGDRSFNEEMRSAWRQGKTLNLFTDEFRSPIPAEATARAVWELVQRNQTGLFHVAGGERLSRLQIGQLLAEQAPELNPKIEPGSLKDYRGAPRSPDTSLNSTKAEQVLGYRLPGLSDWLCAASGKTHPSS